MVEPKLLTAEDFSPKLMDFVYEEFASDEDKEKNKASWKFPYSLVYPVSLLDVGKYNIKDKRDMENILKMLSELIMKPGGTEEHWTIKEFSHFPMALIQHMTANIKYPVLAKDFLSIANSIEKRP